MGGMNGGLAPQLLEKNQLAYAFNATVRGGLITHRPAITRRLTFAWPDPLVQEQVEQGLFQGSCVYRPDSGPSCLIASISGKQFQFSISGSVVTVTDISIADDPNGADTTQAWLWQSERFVIISDGINLPIFYDGSTSRRSDGPTQVLNTATAASSTVPPIGDVFDVTLTGSYTGPFNKPILFHGAYYMAVDNSTQYFATLVTKYDVGTGHDAGAEIVSQPSIAGYMTVQKQAAYNQPNLAANAVSLVITLASPYTGAIGSLLAITGDFDYGNGLTIIWRVTAKSGNTVTVRNNAAIFSPSGVIGYRYPVSTVVQVSGSIAPNVVVARLVNSLATTGPGTSQSVRIRDEYTGAAGAIVYIDGAQYAITAGATVNGSPTLNPITLKNLSDAEGETIVFGTGLPVQTVPELPACRMGAYGMGQNWVSLVDGLSFICSDISRGPSGTPAYDYRDAVLKTTEITFNGGSFAIPSSGSPITSMIFTAKMDESLGQGALQIGTATAIFSVNAPYDFSNPPPLNTPILPEVLKGRGPIGQNSTALVNSDVFFRSVDSIGSFIQARRDFTSWGNTGISDEVNERVLDSDDQSLLPFGSSITFDNRFITTCSPATSPNGVINRGSVVINLDPVSNLSGKADSVYDGLWSGTNTLQYLEGLFDGVSRAFAFGFNTDLLKIELYELLTSKSATKFDNSMVPIVWGFETAGLFNSDVKPESQLMRLINGEFSVDKVIGPVNFKVWYRFDNGCWTEWTEFAVCSSTSGDEQSYPRLGLGEPDATDCDRANNKPAREGYILQVKFEITGHCRFLKARFLGVTADSPEFAPPSCDTSPTCSTVTCVELPDLEAYSLQTGIVYNTTPIGVVVTCPEGAVCVPGNYPITIVYPPGEFVFPNPDTPVFFGIGCSGPVSGATMQEVIDQIAAQQAICDSVITPPPSSPPTSERSTVYLSALSSNGACLGEAYLASIIAVPTSGTVTFELTSGALPTGTSMSVDGNALTIVGTPSVVGYYTFVIKASLSSSVFAVKSYSITVAEIAEDSLPDGTDGVAYSQQLTVNGPQTGSEIWTVSEGELPPGLSLNSSTGEITGTPTLAGTYSFTICYTNAL